MTKLPKNVDNSDQFRDATKMEESAVEKALEAETECSVGKKANCKNCNKEFRQSHRADYYCSNYCINMPKTEAKPETTICKIMSKEYCRLIRIDFDNLENDQSLAIYTTEIGIFTATGKLSAQGNLTQYLENSEELFKPYAGWNGQVYPQWKIEKGFLVC